MPLCTRPPTRSTPDALTRTGRRAPSPAPWRPRWAAGPHQTRPRLDAGRSTRSWRFRGVTDRAARPSSRQGSGHDNSGDHRSHGGEAEAADEPPGAGAGDAGDGEAAGDHDAEGRANTFLILVATALIISVSFLGAFYL